MNVVGIVAEYDPFHKGHEYQIAKAKEITNADYCIVVLSGDFTQRGTPAIVDKHCRAHMALLGGADLVLELPTRFSCSSAEFFASAAVQVLCRCGIVTHLCFGSECDDILALQKLADILVAEPQPYRSRLQEALKNGDSFPVARSKAIASFLNTTEYNSILSNPNNVLGIEYIKELTRLKSSVIPCTIKRLGQDYRGIETLSENEFASASHIRSNIEGQNFDIAYQHMPSYASGLLSESVRLHRSPIVLNDFSNLLNYKLLTSDVESLEDYLDVSSELSRRIKKHLPEYVDFNQFCSLLKTKEITYTRVNRALIHILLNIKKEAYDSQNLLSYASILGFKKESSHIIRSINDCEKIHLISKNADASGILNKHDFNLFEESIRSSHIYESVISEKYKVKPRNLYTISPIID